jgi:phage FluMu protein Com
MTASRDFRLARRRARREAFRAMRRQLEAQREERVKPAPPASGPRRPDPRPDPKVVILPVVRRERPALEGPPAWNPAAELLFLADARRSVFDEQPPAREPERREPEWRYFRGRGRVRRGEVTAADLALVREAVAAGRITRCPPCTFALDAAEETAAHAWRKKRRGSQAGRAAAGRRKAINTVTPAAVSGRSGEPDSGPKIGVPTRPTAGAARPERFAGVPQMPFSDIRCARCRALLFRAGHDGRHGIIEIKCRRCGTLQIVRPAEPVPERR